MNAADRRRWLLGSLVQVASPGASLVDDRNCGCCPDGMTTGVEVSGDNTPDEIEQIVARLFMSHHHHVVVLPGGGWRCAHRGCRAGGGPGGGTAEFFGRLAALAGEGL